MAAIGLSPKCWNREEKPALSQDDERWKERIETVLGDLPFYGYVRVTKELARKGWTVNKKKIHRIMKAAGLLQKRRKRGIKTTNSRHALPIYPNLVKDIIPAFPRHIWASDITYVRLAVGFCYVAIIIDVFTKRIVGWSAALNMETPLVVEALRMALKKGIPKYHHSDRGGQYCSEEYTGILKQNGVAISMADTGVSVDNPYAESFNRTLKVEEVYLADYQAIEDAEASITRFIEDVYDKKRLHSSIGYLPPKEFEMHWLQKNKGRVSLKVSTT